jgi:hypothetical protein
VAEHVVPLVTLVGATVPTCVHSKTATVTAEELDTEVLSVLVALTTTPLAAEPGAV